MAPFPFDLKWDAANYVLIKSHLCNIKIALAAFYIKGKKGLSDISTGFLFHPNPQGNPSD